MLPLSQSQDRGSWAHLLDPRSLRLKPSVLWVRTAGLRMEARGREGASDATLPSWMNTLWKTTAEHCFPPQKRKALKTEKDINTEVFCVCLAASRPAASLGSVCPSEGALQTYFHGSTKTNQTQASYLQSFTENDCFLAQTALSAGLGVGGPVLCCGT